MNQLNEITGVDKKLLVCSQACRNRVSKFLNGPRLRSERLSGGKLSKECMIADVPKEERPLGRESLPCTVNDGAQVLEGGEVLGDGVANNLYEKP